MKKQVRTRRTRHKTYATFTINYFRKSCFILEKKLTKWAIETIRSYQTLNIITKHYYLTLNLTLL